MKYRRRRERSSDAPHLLPATRMSEQGANRFKPICDRAKIVWLCRGVCMISPRAQAVKKISPRAVRAVMATTGGSAPAGRNIAASPRSLEFAKAAEACAGLPGKWAALKPEEVGVARLGGGMSNDMFLCRTPGHSLVLCSAPQLIKSATPRAQLNPAVAFRNFARHPPPRLNRVRRAQTGRVQSSASLASLGTWSIARARSPSSRRCPRGGSAHGSWEQSHGTKLRCAPPAARASRHARATRFRSSVVTCSSCHVPPL